MQNHGFDPIARGAKWLSQVRAGDELQDRL